MIRVTRWRPTDGAVRLDSSPAYQTPPIAWDNGDVIRMQTDGVEIEMPAAQWELACIAVREVLHHRLPAPEPLSLTGKNSDHVHPLETGADAGPSPTTTAELAAAPSMTWEHWLWIGETLMGVDELGLGYRLAALLGHEAGTDEATDGALLDEVGRLLRLHRGGA